MKNVYPEDMNKIKKERALMSIEDINVNVDEKPTLAIQDLLHITDEEVKLSKTKSLNTKIKHAMLFLV